MSAGGPRAQSKGKADMKTAMIKAAGIALAAGVATAAVPGQAREPYLGEIMMFGGNFCPAGWAKANGQILPISDNTALFSLFGNMYGGDARTTFALPDLRGRAPIGPGEGPGLSFRQMGTRVGQEAAAHPSAPVAVAPAAGGAEATAAAPQASHSEADSNMQPSSVVMFCVAIRGSFPPRS